MLKTAPELKAPYSCDPTDSENFCWLTFNTTAYLKVGVETVQDEVGTECKCSLDISSGQSGICGNIMGTT